LGKILGKYSIFWEKIESFGKKSDFLGKKRIFWEKIEFFWGKLDFIRKDKTFGIIDD
jgi:hypothetical protein